MSEAPNPDLERIVEAPTVLAVAEAAGWPCVQLGALVLEGEDAWRRALSGFPPPPPPTRARLLAELGAPWITGPTVATPAAADRLKAWYLAGRPTPTPDEIRRRLVFVGDAPIRDVVVNALQRMPPPVAELVLRGCWTFGVGWSAHGWMAAAPPIHDELPEPLRLLVVSGASRDAEEVATVFAHEGGHVWTMPPTDQETALEPVVEREHRAEALLQLAAACGQLDTWLEGDAERERWAAGCARSWGFKGRAADGAACAAATVARRHRQAAAAPPLGAEP